MKRLLLFLILCSATVGFSQQFRFIEYSVPDGLAQSQVTSIQQDFQGYLWIGTQGGLSKFDGINFTNYSSLDGLTGNSITKLKFDKNNTLWIGANGGVTSFDGVSFKMYPFPKKDMGYSVSDIAFYQNEVYVSVNGGGLFKIQDESLTKLSNQENLHPKVRTLLVKNDTLIIGTRKGLKCITQSKNISNYSIEFDNFSISSLAKKGDSLVVGTYGEGVFLKHQGKLKNWKLLNGSFNRPRQISIAGNGTIWASSKYGVVRIENEKPQVITDKKGLPTNDIFCSYIDTEQNIWFGTSGNGLLKFTSFSFTNYTAQNGLVSNKVMAINQDKKGNIWFGTLDKGISIWDGENFKPIAYEEGLKNLTVRSIYIDSSEILIGTYGGLMSAHLGEQTLIFEQKFEELNNERITCIHKDEIGNYWIGTTNAIWLKNQDSLFQLKPEVWNYGGMIRDILSDKNGNTHIVTSAGYYQVLGKTLKKIPLFVNPNEEVNEVNCIVFNSDNKAIIGTSNGLFIQKGTGFMRREIGSEFNENIINFLELDKNNTLYIGTNNGLFATKNIFKIKPNETLLKFSTSHGLNSVETNLGSSFLDEKNNLWFGTAMGVVHQVDNKVLFQKESSPKLRILDFQLFFESKNWSNFDKLDKFQLPSGIDLKSDENHVTFKFVGLFFKDPENVEYQYRLRGVDENWSPKSKTNAVTFPDLSSGDYTFEVRANYGDGNWSDTESFNFTINAPYYKTWWFFILIFLAILLMLFAFFQYRLNSLKRKKETEKIVMQGRLLALEQRSLNASMNRHFIFNSLNSIQYFINMKDRISANKYLTNFAKLIRKNLDSSTAEDNLVSIEDEVERLKLYLSLEMMRFQNKFDYEMTVSPKLDAEHVKIPSMMLQPFIENSIIHGILPNKKEKGMIKIIIEEESADYVVIEIIDNGIGIEASRIQKQIAQGDHISQGMKITQSRIQILKELTNKNLMLVGPKQVYNSDGSIYGTHVLIKIPT